MEEKKKSKLWKKPDGKDWIVLIVLFLALLTTFAYRADMNACNEVIEVVAEQRDKCYEENSEDGFGWNMTNLTFHSDEKE